MYAHLCNHIKYEQKQHIIIENPLYSITTLSLYQPPMVT